MNDVTRLMTDAQQQLDEHITWLVSEVEKISTDIRPWSVALLTEEAKQIKLRMSRADEDNISIVWEYPDELLGFLRSVTAPEHLRKTLEGGRIVDVNQPGFSAKRLPS